MFSRTNTMFSSSTLTPNSLAFNLSTLMRNELEVMEEEEEIKSQKAQFVH
jgi:hypothetical protein